ncbi:MAG: tetratricopeptide repeat protein [Pseudobacter sp.]|uniref:tetratricopeptide repeat protein n=1 Tax=Pseudobacter sp. TaxID=2045420 RepID=UPI003F7F120D
MPYPIQDIQYVEVNKNAQRPPLKHTGIACYRSGEMKRRSTLQLSDIASYTDEQQKQAISYYRKILKENPDQYFAAFNLGLFYLQRKEFIPAYACFGIARKANSADVYSIYHLGEIAFELQDYKTSLSYFQSVQIHDHLYQLSDKNMTDLRIYIGRINVRINKPEEAAEIFTDIANNESYGRLVAVHQLAHIYLNILNNFHLAEPWIDHALMLTPLSTIFVRSKILVLKATGKLQEAMPYLKDMTRIDPAGFETYYDLACLYAERNNEAATREFLEKAVRLSPQARTYARSDIDFAHYFNQCWFQNLMK